MIQNVMTEEALLAGKFFTTYKNLEYGFNNLYYCFNQQTIYELPVGLLNRGSKQNEQLYCHVGKLTDESFVAWHSVFNNYPETEIKFEDLVEIEFD